jgi:phosphoribosyl 1,2-cyclic phosphodiesterase
MIRFISFTSGSCGNCSLLLRVPEDPLAPPSGILIDAGMSFRRLKRGLQEVGLTPDCLRAVLVTHDHLDHIRHLGSFCKRLALPVFTTSVLQDALQRHSFTAGQIVPCRRDLAPDAWNEVAEGFEVQYFEVPHDATQTVGYAIRADGHRFVLMTDLGHLTPEALSFAKEADTVVVESNFDVDMLLGGDYPHELKMRICQGYGHLSNDACADAIRAFWHPGLKNLFLCHLSGNNNTPKRAFDNAAETLRGLGVDPAEVHLRVLPRGEQTPLLTL